LPLLIATRIAGCCEGLRQSILNNRREWEQGGQAALQALARIRLYPAQRPAWAAQQQ